MELLAQVSTLGLPPFLVLGSCEGKLRPQYLYLTTP